MKVWKFIWGQKGRWPSVNQLDHETIAKDKESGKLYMLIESQAGVKQVIEIPGAAPGSSDAHLRSHSITSPLDHPPVAAADYDKLVATNPTTGAIEMIAKSSVGGDSLELDPATATFQGLKVALVAGENLTKGQPCYMSASKMYRGDADALASTYCFAIASDTILADASGLFLLIGVIGGYTGLTVGAPVYLSAAIGELTQTLVTGTNKVVQIVGVAVSATHIYFKPELAQIELV